MADVHVHLQATPEWLAEGRPQPHVPMYVSPDRDEAGRPVLTVERLGGDRVFPAAVRGTTSSSSSTVPVARSGAPGPSRGRSTTSPPTCLARSSRSRSGAAASRACTPAPWPSRIAPSPSSAVCSRKSTLAAALATRGCAVISDDVVALSRIADEYVVHPGPPRIRLWPDSVRALYGSTDALPRLTPAWDKRFLDLTGRNIG